MGSDLDLQLDAHETSPLAETTCFGYDENGNQAAIVAPGGEVTYYAYDPLNGLSHIRADALYTDAVASYTYDPAGNTTRILDAEAHPTSFAYDPLVRLSSETDANGNLIAHTNGDGQRALRHGASPVAAIQRLSDPVAPGHAGSIWQDT